MDNDITCNIEYYIDDEFHPHRSKNYVNTMRLSVHRVIKLLTLVQDSSMEQKPELFPCAKVVIKVGIAKSLPRFLCLHNKRYDESI